jgi:hypothetical protein
MECSPLSERVVPTEATVYGSLPLSELPLENCHHHDPIESVTITLHKEEHFLE